MNIANDPFGTERLRELCHGQAVATPRQLLERIFATVREFARGRAQHDDMAATLFQYLGPEADQQRQKPRI